MKKNLIVPLIVLLLISLSVLPVMASGWPQFANDAANSGIVEAETPISENEAELKFQLRVREEDSWDTLSNIVIMDDSIYIAVGSQLRKINQEGEIVGSFSFEKPVSSSPFIAGSDGFIYAFISDGSTGQLQAVDAATMTSAWVSESVTGVESYSPITIYDNHVYLAVSGFDYSLWSATPGYVLGIEAGEASSDTEKLFSLVYDGGLSYYWNGAAVSGDYLLQGSVEGVIQVIDRKDGSLLDEIDTGKNIKTSLTLEGGNIYFGTDSGVGSIAIAEGQLDPESLQLLDLGSQVTTTPVVYRGRLYAGTGDFQGGEGFFVINTADMSIAYKDEIPGVDSWSGADIPVAGIQSTPVLTSFYGDDVYLYFSLNAKPSSIIALKDAAGQETADWTEIFTPEEADQNATMASFVADANGTIYYTNDAGLLFAVAKTDDPADDETGTDPAPTETQEVIPPTGEDSFVIAGELILLVVISLAAVIYIQQKKRKKQSRENN